MTYLHTWQIHDSYYWAWRPRWDYQNMRRLPGARTGPADEARTRWIDALHTHWMQENRNTLYFKEMQLTGNAINVKWEAYDLYLSNIWLHRNICIWHSMRMRLDVSVGAQIMKITLDHKKITRFSGPQFWKMSLPWAFIGVNTICSSNITQISNTF